MAPSNHELFQRASLLLPGGVSSPVRSFSSVGGEPFFVASGKGAYLTDVEGNRYLDFVQSWGASILGHADERVVSAVVDAARNGTSFGAPTPGEVELAQAIVDRVDAVEMVRFVSSGTEAAMTAIRLARGITGRSRIVKFAGCYHGHADALLAAGGSGVATLGLSGSAGVPDSAVADTIVVDYNVVPDLDESVAAVIVEPIAANMGLVAPADGFLTGLRSACDAVGALLVFDEVITGFRLAPGGASQHYGVSADLYCFGKVVGGGLPLGAIGGRASTMSQLAPTGPIYQAGTLSGNPMATAAGLAALRALDDDAYDALVTRATSLQAGLSEAFQGAGLEAQVPRVGPIVGVFFASEAVENFDQAKVAAANGRYVALFHELLARGVFFPPSPYEVLFCSLAHGEGEIAATVEAVRESARAVASR